MQLYSTKLSQLQALTAKQFVDKNVQVFVKRDDLIDKEVSGNKWRKLNYSIELANYQKKEGILTFGGAFSNHLLATAAACNKSGLKSIGVVRGEELTETSNENLKRCAELGMQLIFISRVEYQLRNEKITQEEWKEDYPTFLLVPEGGANYHGLIGCQEIIQEIPFECDHIFVAQGTTTTSCGILTALPENTTLHVVPALKGFDALAEMKSILYPFYVDDELIADKLKQVVVHEHAHFGGYAKTTPELIAFKQAQQQAFDLPLDLVYTAKAFYALLAWIDQLAPFDELQKIVFIHTGGLLNGQERIH
ncbi:MAG: pyridoxal-phosphate dependent enzyme [Fluviicola sp.]|nr:pyridoxal-phosphate dependent enzyme [Fluviicola sp.]MBP6271559.1 pyridoxal-phosphate dependent enzyme [Fluviicola sp.]